MKKAFIFIIALFALCATIEATAAPADKRPKNGYNYQKAKAKQARHNFFYKSKIQRANTGCGWMKR